VLVLLVLLVLVLVLVLVLLVVLLMIACWMRLQRHSSDTAPNRRRRGSSRRCAPTAAR
jgi:uncharacterized membrane protein